MTEPWIQTYTGLAFDFESPCAHMVSVDDIAVALSVIPRFVGHTKTGPYSVAQHCVLCSHEMERVCCLRRMNDETVRRMSLAALLHDAHEAYIGDLPRPLIMSMSSAFRDEWKALKRELNVVIAERFGITAESMESELMAEIDLQMLGNEARDLMGAPSDWDVPRPMGPEIVPWTAKAAELAFRKRLHDLAKAGVA